jgi:RND family efflux transporter MFP subunit
MLKDKNEKEEVLGLGEKLSKERLSSGRKRWTRRLLIAVAALIVMAGGYLAFFSGSAGAKYEFVKVTTRDIHESVEITGNVEPGASINLSFRESGQVDKINYEVGAELKKGDIIASLKNRDQELRLDQARAALAGAQANLAEKLAGYTNEDIRIAETGLQKSEAGADKVSIDWDNAKRELDLMKKKYEQDENTAQLLVDEAKNKYDYALKNQTNLGKTQDQSIEMSRLDLEAQLYSTGSQIQQSLTNLENIIINDGNSVLEDDYSRLDYNKVNQATQLYGGAQQIFEPMFADFKSRSDYEPARLEEFAKQEQSAVTKILEAQKLTVDVLTKLVPSTTITESKISELKTKVLNDSVSLSTSFAALNLKYQNILDAQQGKITSGDTRESEVTSAKNYYDQQLQNLEKIKIDHQVDLNARESSIRSLQAQYQIQLADIDGAKAALQLRRAGPRAVDVAFLRTQVTVNQIAVSLAEEALEKTLLRAPMDGVLSRRNIEAGEDVVSSSSLAAGSGTSVFEMISSQKFKINAEIAEVDINKLKVGDKAEITLDAVGDEVIFPGTIVKIDPVETIVQDVVFYKAEVVIDSEDERIRPGMTANVEIVLREAKGALTVPDKSIQTDNGRKYVRILQGEKVKNIDVEAGIRDLQGNVEIKKGLVEGQEIILRTINGRTS